MDLNRCITTFYRLILSNDNLNRQTEKLIITTPHDEFIET